MFHSFLVDPKHMNFLRFLWFMDNDPTRDFIEYRMTVHLFGNGPSPALATYGVRRTVEKGEELEPGVKEFVERNFYVDDGLVSKPIAEETIKLVRDTHAALSMANIRLHKVVSNSVSVMKAFPTEVVAKDIRSLDLTSYRHSVHSVSFGTWKEWCSPTKYQYLTDHSLAAEFFRW